MDIKEYKIGEITVQAVHDSVDNSLMEAIVCPGNSKGFMRGGASQAIRTKWGDYIELEAKKQAPIHIGKAVNIPLIHSLSPRGIIYTAAIVHPVDCATERSIFAASKASIKCALRNGYHSVAFPIIGSGTGQVEFFLACRSVISGIFSEQWNSSQLPIIGVYVRRNFKFDILNDALSQFSQNSLVGNI